MNYLTMSSYRGRYSHAAFRQLLIDLWSTKQKHLDFRTFKTLGFSTYGSGRSWFWMKKWGNTFVCGTRVWDPDKDVEPTRHFSDVWAICQNNRTLFPAIVDQARNNWLAGMGFYGLGAFSHPDRDIPNTSGFCLYGDQRMTLITSGVEMNSTGIRPYGSAIVDPEVQIYDRGLFNKGRQALLLARRYLDVYINRHGVLTGGHSWSGWNAEFIGHLVQHFLTSERPPPPEEILSWWKETDHYYWLKDKIPLPGQGSIRAAWKQIGVHTGFCRIVPRGTPLYNEGLPIPPYEPDYDKIILSD